MVVGIDTHIVMIPGPGNPVPTPLPNPFYGPLNGELSSSVFIDDHAAATKGSEAENSPPHIPAGGPFQTPPSNKGTVVEGSTSVFADGKPVARHGDRANTCNDPSDAPKGRVVAKGSVIVA